MGGAPSKGVAGTSGGPGATVKLKPGAPGGGGVPNQVGPRASGVRLGSNGTRRHSVAAQFLSSRRTSSHLTRPPFLLSPRLRPPRAPSDVARGARQSAVRKAKEQWKQQQSGASAAQEEMLKRMASGVDNDGTIASSGHLTVAQVPEKRSNPYIAMQADPPSTVKKKAKGKGDAESDVPDESAVRDYILRKYMRFYFSPMLTEEKVIDKMKKDLVAEGDIYRFRSAMRLLSSMKDSGLGSDDIEEIARTPGLIEDMEKDGRLSTHKCRELAQCCDLIFPGAREQVSVGAAPPSRRRREDTVASRRILVSS